LVVGDLLDFVIFVFDFNVLDVVDFLKVGKGLGGGELLGDGDVVGGDTSRLVEVCERGGFAAKLS
jgi:hypothetical protein